MDNVLVGDIGGTNSRLRLIEVPCDQAIVEGDLAGVLRVNKQYSNEGVPAFVDVVKQFFKDCEEVLGKPLQTPKVAAFAVAGPVDCNMVAFTNRSSWVIDGEALAKELGITTVRLVNDFVANGYGLLALKDNETHVLQDVPPKPNAPIALIGAGTGLGECFLTSPPSLPSPVYDAWPSEGGHTEFAPRTALEIELLAFLKQKFGEGSRVSVERICSGKGISNVYEFLRQRFPDKVNAEVDKKWEEAGDLRGKVVNEHADKDILCKWAMEIFVSTYGSEAGAVGLKYLCYGGLYIAGGIAPNNIARLEASRCHRGVDVGFLAAFHDKGRVSKLMSQIPLKVVLAQDIGQRGAHLMALRLLRGLREADKE